MQAKGKLPKYYQLEHNINHNDLFLISSINFDQGDGSSCPAKTIVVFAHLEDFNYANQPEIVSTMN